MKTIYTPKHRLRNPNTELAGGELVKPYERPSRAEHVIQRVREVNLGEIADPRDFGLRSVLRIHDEAYVAFLREAWSEWRAAGHKGEAIPSCWPARRMVQKPPLDIEGKLGYYAMANETSISPGTWEAALAGADVALTGAAVLTEGAGGAFALCRPPGHHAAADLYGGYCFFNNAALAAQYLLDEGAARIAIVDVDFHHGNGTQDIFYRRGDVLYASLHGDPRYAFPHFLGYADERGEGNGQGCNFNYPMRPGTEFPQWREALACALGRVRDYSPDALVVSLGVDTFAGDPISFFRLAGDDFTVMGADISGLRLPTLFIFEGGYDIDEVGVNTVNVLTGFESAA